MTSCTPALLALIATDWSVPELRAAIACLIDLLDARTDADPLAPAGERASRS